MAKYRKSDIVNFYDGKELIKSVEIVDVYKDWAHENEGIEPRQTIEFYAYTYAYMNWDYDKRKHSAGVNAVFEKIKEDCERTGETYKETKTDYPGKELVEFYDIKKVHKAPCSGWIEN